MWPLMRCSWLVQTAPRHGSLFRRPGRGARLRGGMGYLASMDGLNLPDLTPRRSAGSMGRSIGGSLPAITFAPQITVSGSMSEEDVNKLVELLYQKFAEFMDRYNRERRRTSYA